MSGLEYVHVLLIMRDNMHFLFQIFKEPLEHPVQRGGPILDNEDVKSIFGNISEIRMVHEKLVVSI